ncbi:MAG: hypothetical protein IJ033_04170 [Clostridia bacterium]|nr:hypothetical protein [Clostridia bacterium]
MAYEIERKFLIDRIDEEYLVSLGATKKEIAQSYLVPSPSFPVRRIRKTEENGATKYFYTEKRAVGKGFACEENECEISANQYLKLQKERDFALNEIVKTRYVLSQNGLDYEFDFFPFFPYYAILEIELQAEDSPYEIPNFVRVVKEVTFDYAYTNRSMAKEIPLI